MEATARTVVMATRTVDTEVVTESTVETMGTVEFEPRIHLYVYLYLFTIYLVLFVVCLFSYCLLFNSLFI